MKVGLIGLGRMGQGMAHRLLGGGHDLLVFNRTAGKAADLEKAGAKIARHRRPMRARIATSSSVWWPTMRR